MAHPKGIITLTNQPPDLDTAKRDRPAIEVTDAMMEAGRQVLEDSGRLYSDRMSGDDLLAQEVFRAMWCAAPHGRGMSASAFPLPAPLVVIASYRCVEGTAMFAICWRRKADFAMEDGRVSYVMRFLHMNYDIAEGILVTADSEALATELITSLPSDFPTSETAYRRWFEHAASLGAWFSHHGDQLPLSDGSEAQLSGLSQWANEFLADPSRSIPDVPLTSQVA